MPEQESIGFFDAILARMIPDWLANAVDVWAGSGFIVGVVVGIVVGIVTAVVGLRLPPSGASVRRYPFWTLPALAAVILALVGIRALIPGPNGDAARPVAGAPASEPDIRRSVSSAYYTFTLTLHTALVPPPDRRRAGGSLAPLGDGFLLVTATGEFYRLSWEPGANALRSDRLSLSAPFNRGALFEAAGDVVADRFRITDLLVDDRGDATRVYVAHHHWDSRANCVSLRVSSTVLPAAGGSPDQSTRWNTLFDSQPCLAVGKMWPNEAIRSGGRLARHDLGLLLSVGDHGFDGLSDPAGVVSFPQAADASYGKILLLEMGGGGAVPFSIGYRNPQGLIVDNQDRVWSTEQGPEGGDELNLVVRGGNYGWPLATYGTDYERDVWPLALNPRNHGRFREPALAFVPSVAPSDLLQVSSKYLPRWSDDLLLGSLDAGMLFRVRTTGNDIVYTEGIDLSMRIRDLAEGQDGRILIWNDDGQVASLVLAREASDR